MSGIHQPEDVVEDKVAPLSIREELEALTVTHWRPFFVDLRLLLTAWPTCLNGLDFDLPATVQ